MPKRTRPPILEDPEALQDLLVEMASILDLESLFQLVTGRLGSCKDFALVRIWLQRPGDRCGVCTLRDECPREVDCLHLVASRGRSRREPELEWSAIDGRFSRFPLGVRKIGHIGETGESIEVRDLREEGNAWVADREWARREGLRSFLGTALVFRQEIRGVFGMFLRRPLTDDAVFWVRLIADHLAAAIANAQAFEEIERLRHRLELENSDLRAEIREVQAFGSIVGSSAALRATLEQIELVAPTDASVLIEGESGTGKELVAREIHERSARREDALVKVNCASIPRELYESEFFGHVKGAFTGALQDRTGRFELADGGTLLLDEVGEIPLELQSKLLRVLQEGQYERVGDDRTRQVDVRVLSATNRDLEQEVGAGRFRRDLYYRLAVFPIHLPPLSERIEDVPALAQHFLDGAARRLGRQAPPITPAALHALQGYSWPGNVRELQNVIERALITSPPSRLVVDLVPDAKTAVRRAADGSDGADAVVMTEAQMRAMERNNLRAALDAADGKLYGEDGAAALLGIRPTTLASRLKKLGLKR